MTAPPLFVSASDPETESMEDIHVSVSVNAANGMNLKLGVVGVGVPKLHLSGSIGPTSLPKYLDLLAPPTYPFTSPAWSLPRKPRAISILDVYKSHELLMTYTVDQKPIYLIGRNAVVCDIVFNHCSISRLHAAIIHHKDNATYVVDLGSCHGTFVDDVRLHPLQPTLLLDGSMLKFGASSRSYSFKSFESQEQIVEIVRSRLGLEPEEMQLQENTMMNKALSYRLGFSIPIQSGGLSDSNDEDDDPMSACPRRQMESSGSSVPRRSQSEDNVIAAGAALRLQAAVSGAALQDQGRKRTRAQSANVPSTRFPLGSADATTTTQANHQQDSPASSNAITKRVHFSQQAPAVIPSSATYEAPLKENEADVVTPRNLANSDSALEAERFVDASDDGDVIVETPRD